MLAPNNGSQAKKVVGLPIGVWTYILSAQPNPDGQGVGSGRNTVGVPPTVKVVDATLAIVGGLLCREKLSSSSKL